MRNGHRDSDMQGTKTVQLSDARTISTIENGNLSMTGTSTSSDESSDRASTPLSNRDEPESFVLERDSGRQRSTRRTGSRSQSTESRRLNANGSPPARSARHSGQSLAGMEGDNSLPETIPERISSEDEFELHRHHHPQADHHNPAQNHREGRERF